MLSRTRLILTFQYSLLLLVVFWCFSLGIYVYMDRTFGGDYPKNTGQVMNDTTEVADSGLDSLRTGLLIINGVLLLVVPLVSFVLANSSLRPVRESFESQQRFVDDAAHELRTPIAITQAELELALQKPRTNKEYRQVINVSYEETKRLGELVHNLLFLSRGHLQDIHNSLKAVPINSLVLKVVEELKDRSESTPKISSSLRSKDKVLVNPELMQIAITNILENAIKYTKADGQIIVNTTAKKDFVILSIKDTGIGMGLDETLKAFDRFWRAEASRHKKGYGLGLPLAKQIIELHGGMIQINSVPQEGTTVRVSLPIHSV